MSRARCESPPLPPSNLFACTSSFVLLGVILYPVLTHKKLTAKCAGCSKKIQFGLMSPAQIMNNSEFHVYRRALYTVSTQLPGVITE